MTLVSEDGKEIHGSYFYERHLEDISLVGEYLSPRDILLREYDARKQLIATLQLHASEHDPRFPSLDSLEGEVLTGTWKSKDGNRSLPVNLNLVDILSGSHDLNRRYASAGAQSDSEVEKNAQAFYSAVLNGDKQKTGVYVHYPLLVFFSGTKSWTIGNKAEFVKDFTGIFTHEYLECLAKATPHGMFANYQGVMLGDGLVWFDERGYAKTLNPCAEGSKKR